MVKVDYDSDEKMELQNAKLQKEKFRSAVCLESGGRSMIL